jgi:putative hydrolase of the HAD superfamily
MVDQPAPEHIRLLRPLPTGHPPGGRLIKPVEAVLFDVYGTLFISGSGDVGTAEKKRPAVTAVETLCRQFGIDALPDQISRQLTDTIRADHAHKRAAGIPYPEIEIELIWQQILGWKEKKRLRDFALAYEWLVNPSFPMPGVEETLRTLRRRGRILGIVSNAQFFTPLLFRWFLGADPEKLGFDPGLTVYSYRCGEAKPSETLFRLCADKLQNMGVAPASIVFVGNDMINDILPAAKVGWQTALFAGDSRSLRLRQEREECRSLRPDLVVTDLRQLLAWC